jgi:hypothetical protein
MAGIMQCVHMAQRGSCNPITMLNPKALASVVTTVQPTRAEHVMMLLPSRFKYVRVQTLTIL